MDAEKIKIKKYSNSLTIIISVSVPLAMRNPSIDKAVNQINNKTGNSF